MSAGVLRNIQRCDWNCGQLLHSPGDFNTVIILKNAYYAAFTTTLAFLLKQINLLTPIPTSCMEDNPSVIFKCYVVRHRRHKCTGNSFNRRENDDRILNSFLTYVITLPRSYIQIKAEPDLSGLKWEKKC